MPYPDRGKNTAVWTNRARRWRAGQSGKIGPLAASTGSELPPWVN